MNSSNYMIGIQGRRYSGSNIEVILGGGFGVEKLWQRYGIDRQHR